MNNILFIHILISIIALCVLALASVQGILIHIQNKKLKNNQFPEKFKFFAPLQTMQHFLFQLVAIGFILLTVSLISTLFFDSNLKQSLFTRSTISKIVFSMTSWFLLAILLYKHYQSGWRGPSAIRWILISMGLLIVAYGGGKLFFMQYGQ